MIFDKIIVAIGSKAGLKENENYALLASLGIKMTPILPALCPLILSGNFLTNGQALESKQVLVSMKIISLLKMT